MEEVTCCTNFMNVLSRKETVFHRRAKLFELNFFTRKPFVWIIKPGG